LKSVDACCYNANYFLFHRLALIINSDFLIEPTNGFRILNILHYPGIIYVYNGLLKENNEQ